MTDRPQPTERELGILKILWRRGESTVRDVYEEMRLHAPIVQNTVQAFLRTMDDKGLVRHRTVGRTFVYTPAIERERAEQSMISGLLERVFDGALDQLVDSALSVHRPTSDELARLESIVAEAKAAARKRGARRARP